MTGRLTAEEVYALSGDPALPAPLSQETFRALSESDRRRIRVVVNLDGETTVEFPEDLNTSRVRSMARFAEIYLGGHLKALLDGWKGPGDG